MASAVGNAVISMYLSLLYCAIVWFSYHGFKASSAGEEEEKEMEVEKTRRETETKCS